MTAEPSAPCPGCSASLPASAVLCVACGYHLKLGYHLATATDEDAPPKPAIDMNPYAAPAVPDSQAVPTRGSNPDFDLNEYGAARAKAVVSEANSVLLLCIFACICGPAWLLMLPWFAYRLYCWYDLNASYAELREPNSFSPHGQLAADFVDAKPKLIAGVVIGGLFWTILALAFLVRLTRL